MEKKILTAKWEYLIMANYCIEPDILMPYLPYKTELDFYNDNCYVSLVGFLFTETRIKGIKVPFHINFEEVNLRFYVRHKQETGYMRGVVFISEIVPKPAIAFIANTLYNEQYRYMPMQYQVQKEKESIKAVYKWKYKNKWNALSVEAGINLMEMEPGSEGEFIAEHYHGYSKLNTAATNEYQVAHPRWKMFPVKTYSIDCHFEELYGSDFGFLSQAIPASLFFYEGSAVSIGQKNSIH